MTKMANHSHGRARLLAGREAEEHGPRAFGRPQDADRCLGDDAELPLRAVDQAEQIVAGGIEMGAADLDNLAIEHHHRDAQHIVGGDAVFEAMGAARVHADIAADRAGELGGRVGRIEEALGRNGTRHGEVGDARLDPGDAIGIVDLEDAVHLRDADDDGILLRDRSARERGARAARNHRHALLQAIAQHRRDLPGRLGQHDGQGHAAIGGECVGLVGSPLVVAGDQRLRRDESRQSGDDRIAAGENAGIRRRKSNRAHLPPPREPHRSDH